MVSSCIERVSSTLSTALRVYLCFVPDGISTTLPPTLDQRFDTPMTKQLGAHGTNAAAISLESGVVDCILIVGTTKNEDYSTSFDKAHMQFQYQLLIVKISHFRPRLSVLLSKWCGNYRAI
ncbi:hypothetical protein PsorP6_008228 [Peronosclerospora sorghi]|uniref:Uncharacterized protein n=1 Tax=Peronosclerospora sorghi TaxID=230839 RepID=A0ACC0WBL5_9STRA|nr:hypothetical protein PsorP6_008228 [Peronosclerospora sorghi]